MTRYGKRILICKNTIIYNQHLLSQVGPLNRHENNVLLFSSKGGDSKQQKTKKKPKNLRNYTSRQNRSWPWTFPVQDIESHEILWHGRGIRRLWQTPLWSLDYMLCSAVAINPPSLAGCALCKPSYSAHTNVYKSTAVFAPEMHAAGRGRVWIRLHKAHRVWSQCLGCHSHQGWGVARLLFNQSSLWVSVWWNSLGTFCTLNP